MPLIYHFIQGHNNQKAPMGIGLYTAKKIFRLNPLSKINKDEDIYRTLSEISIKVQACSSLKSDYDEINA